MPSIRRCGNCRQPGHNRRTCPGVIRLRIGPNITPEQSVRESGIENTYRLRAALRNQIQDRIERREGLTDADEQLRSQLDLEITHLNNIQTYLVASAERSETTARPNTELSEVRERQHTEERTVEPETNNSQTPSGYRVVISREIQERIRRRTGINTPRTIVNVPEIRSSIPARRPDPPSEPEAPREPVKVIESEECPICMEKFDDVKVDKATLKCGHQLCSGCFASWMREKHTCPSCREPIVDKIVKKYTLTRRVREHLTAEGIMAMRDQLMFSTFGDAINSFRDHERMDRNVFIEKYFENVIQQTLCRAGLVLERERP